MANETTSSTISELYTEIVAEALFVAQEQSVMRGLVRNYTIAGGGKSVEVPIYSTVSAAAVNEATDLSNTAVNPSSVTITASEVGIMTTLTDLARNSASRNVAADIGRLFGESIAKKIDTDLTALFDGFSTSIGGAGQELTVDKIFQAVATLRQANVPGPYFGVLNPKVAYNVKKSLTNTFVNPNPNDLTNEALRTGYIGNIAGVQIFETSNVDGTTDTDNCKGAIFSRDALGLAMMQDLKIESQRDASLRADEIVATAVYGVGELHDTYGVEMLAESVIN
jgi:N4-gp56 family major capsid protein